LQHQIFLSGSEPDDAEVEHLDMTSAERRAALEIRLQESPEGLVRRHLEGGGERIA
jgi:hypothetical protein